MSIVQFARFKSNNAEQVIKNARVAKKIFEKHGLNFFGSRDSTRARGRASG